MRIHAQTAERLVNVLISAGVIWEDDHNAIMDAWRMQECLFDDTDHTIEIRKYARDNYEQEGFLEIDDDAIVSESDDNGVYIQMWKWIDFNDTEFDKEQII
jgi:hypothetical protein